MARRPGGGGRPRNATRCLSVDTDGRAGTAVPARPYHISGR